MRRLLITFLAILAMIGCNDADIASHNLSQAADNFQISRRIIFYNGIAGEYILELSGLCSLGNTDKARELSVTCKVGANSYKKHFLGLSDNVTFFAEQIEPDETDVYHYNVTFKPSMIIPRVRIK